MESRNWTVGSLFSSSNISYLGPANREAQKVPRHGIRGRRNMNLQGAWAIQKYRLRLSLSFRSVEQKELKHKRISKIVCGGRSLNYLTHYVQLKLLLFISRCLKYKFNCQKSDFFLKINKFFFDFRVFLHNVISKLEWQHLLNRISQFYQNTSSVSVCHTAGSDKNYLGELSLSHTKFDKTRSLNLPTKGAFESKQLSFELKFQNIFVSDKQNENSC